MADYSPHAILEPYRNRASLFGETVESAESATISALTRMIENTDSICKMSFHYICEAKDTKTLGQVDLTISTYEQTLKFEVEKQNSEDTRTIPKITEPYLIWKKVNGDMCQFEISENPAAQDGLKSWRTEYAEALSYVTGEENPHRPDIICLQEFAYPLNPSKWFDDDFESRVATILRDLKSFVCLGTQHRNDTDGAGSKILCNSAKIYLGEAWTITPAQKSFEDKEVQVKHSSNTGFGTLETATADLETKSFEFVSNVTSINKTISARNWMSLHERLSWNDVKAHKDQLLARIKSTASNLFIYWDSFGKDVPKSADRKKFAIIAKNSPALKQKEAMIGHGMPNLDVFVTKHGTVAVMICHDVFDPALLLRVVKQNLDSQNAKQDFFHPKIDMILVPSCNKSKKFLLACETLSYLAGAVVVYANSYKTDFKQSEIYAFGRSIEKWKQIWAINNIDVPAPLTEHFHDETKFRTWQIKREFFSFMQTKHSPLTQGTLVSVS